MRILLILILCAQTLFAGVVTIPNSFTNGQVADADDINQNFITLVDAINSGNVGGSSGNLFLDNIDLTSTLVSDNLVIANEASVAGELDVTSLVVTGQANISGTIFPSSQGLPNQMLKMNVGGTNLEWVDSNVNMVRVHTATLYGTTDTKVRRFTNVVSDLGPAITYADSATAGGTFTVNEDGFYSITYSDRFVSPSHFCITLNCTANSTISGSLSLNEVLAVSASSDPDFSDSMSWSGYLNAGDVVRAHADGAASSASNGSVFTIAKSP
ncbi:MAG: hypothetical protein HQL32_12440 [Planctomycetes bacterium]|nr:hypothetical protein [Planctomycetota bacterium]